MTKGNRVSLREILMLLALAAVLVVAVRFVARMGDVQQEGQTEFVTRAVRRAALTCYAVEGAYPDDISYLREQYGLAFDEDRYAVTYDAFASNQLPEIYVTERK